MFKKSYLCLSLFCALGVSACAEVSVPDARNVKIPSPVTANERVEAVNERPDSVMYLPLGADVLVPERISGDVMPDDRVGPFELRSETLAGALQLILAEYDISIAFETEEGLTRKVTVANLKGPLYQVVNRVCSLADLYCSYEEETLVIKDRQTFAVTLPPLADAEGGDEFIDDVIQGLSAVLGEGTSPVSDPTTRTVIYTATQRTAKLAENYFQRLRANTAMIVFETYIWEVSLNSGNSTGIDWDEIEAFGKFNASIDFSGSTAADFTNPVSIGLPTTQALGANPAKLVEFLSQFGAVKTISQPQITVLSGSEAELRVADTQNYVSEVSSTISGDNTTTSVSTDSVDSGFTLTIGSSWDKSTVYSNVNINLTNVVTIDDFAFDTDDGGGQTTIQLPQTTERELATQIRVRPGDSVLIAGLVRETDNFNSRGPGFMEPILPDSRTARTENLELVILLRPRVVVYTSPENGDYDAYVKNSKKPELVSPKTREEWIKQQPRPETITEPKDAVSKKEPVVQRQPLQEIVTPNPIAPEPIVVEAAPESVSVSQPIIAPNLVIEEPSVGRPEIFSPAVEVKTNINADAVLVAPQSDPVVLAPVAPSSIIEPPQPVVKRTSPSSYVSRAPTASLSERPSSITRSNGIVSRSDRALSRVIEESSSTDFYATSPISEVGQDSSTYIDPKFDVSPAQSAENFDGGELTIAPSVDLYGDYRPSENSGGNLYEDYERNKEAF